MLYRFLRPDENYHSGLSARNTNSDISVFDHVINGSINGSNQGWWSRYISTCGSLDAVKTFRRKSVGAMGYIVQISVDNLSVDIIDLRTQQNRNNYYTQMNSKDDIDKFNYYANLFEEVLLVGNVPASHIQLVVEFN